MRNKDVGGNVFLGVQEKICLPQVANGPLDTAKDGQKHSKRGDALWYSSNCSFYLLSQKSKVKVGTVCFWVTSWDFSKNYRILIGA